MNKSKYCGITGDELANMLRKPSKYSKKEAEEIIEKAEELTPLEALDHIKTYARLDACERCQYYKNGNCENNIGECMWKDEINIIETTLKAQEENDFELEVFKLAYEWKCNGVKGTYEEVLEQAKRTVEGWHEINKKGYGTIIDEGK